MGGRRAGLITGVVWVALGWSVFAAVLVVEPGGALPTLGAALAAATDGDAIVLTAGRYEEGRLYVWHNQLTIEAATEPPLLARTALVVVGRNFQLRRVTLDGERAPELTNLLHFVFASGARVEDCTIKNPPGGDGSGELGDLLTQAPLSEFNESGSCVRIADGQDMILRRCNLASDRDDAIVNEVNLFSYTIGRPSRGLVIEDCTFAAQTRNVMLVDSHEDVTIRRCHFARTASGDGDRLGLSAWSAAGLVCIPPAPEAPTRFQDVRLSDNRFSGVSGIGILFYNGRVDGAEIAGNVFEEGYAPNLVVKCGGDAMLVSGNTFRQAASPEAGGALVETASPQLAPAGERLAPLRMLDNRFAAAGGDAILLRAAGDEWIENNLFSSIPGWAVRAEAGAPRLAFVGNDVDGGGVLPGEHGALFLSGPAEVVRGNRFLYHDGAVQFAGVGGGKCFVADNLIAHMAAYGIRELNSGFAGNRYFNNTLVFIDGPAVQVRSDHVHVYNNIFAYNESGLVVHSGAPGRWDFNLFFLNGVHHEGLARAGANDRFADPGFVDLGAEDFRLSSASPARNAGTAPMGPLTEPDFVTELGFWQDTRIDTSVPRRGWEEYR